MTIKRGKPFWLNLGLPAEAVPLQMVWIPPGRFIMGSLPDEPGATSSEVPFHATLTRGFWLGRYLVTQAQWLAVMGTNPSYFRTNGMNRPVEQVSWHDAVAFCERLNQQFAPHVPVNYHFHLPTEMQWEYACRAGTRMMFPNGMAEDDLARIAWYAGNSDGQTHPVGQKEPNAWGLYDMLGNVTVWCYDEMADHPVDAATDWIGRAEGKIRDFELRPFRSCAYFMGPGACRISAREWVADNLRVRQQGFRLCLRWRFEDA